MCCRFGPLEGMRGFSLFSLLMTVLFYSFVYFVSVDMQIIDVAENILAILC